MYASEAVALADLCMMPWPAEYAHILAAGARVALDANRSGEARNLARRARRLAPSTDTPSSMRAALLEVRALASQQRFSEASELSEELEDAPRLADFPALYESVHTTGAQIRRALSTTQPQRKLR
jgi:hypothetical protein